MDLKTLAMYLYSLIGRTRGSSSDAPRNACGLTENVKIAVESNIQPQPEEASFKAPDRQVKQQDIRMALARQNFAGLPDIDDAAPEIYETPELTDDASTVQTATQRTNSPTPSDEPDFGRHDPDIGLDRQRIDRGEARRRFEPSLVDARDANFSDSLAGGRGSYITSFRRRRRRRDSGAEELGYLSDSEDESLGRKLARLRREAEEVKLELQRREQEKGEGEREEDDEGLEDGVGALSLMLNGLIAPSRAGQISAEATLSKKLASELKTKTSPPTSQPSAPPESSPQPLTLTSLATLSDRLTALETSLGLSTTTPMPSAPILPTLASLASQITTLSTTLSPPSTTSHTTPITLSLDTLTTRVRDLTSQADMLTLSRKAATQAASDLRQARLKAAASPTPPIPHPSYSTGGGPQHLHPNHRSSTTTTTTTTTNTTNTTNALPQETLKDLLAHEEQNSKIHALYATLPRIQELSPLLPLVLERLRSLQSIHTGAAAVSGNLEALEKVQAEMGREIEEWKIGLERVGSAVREGERIMKGNGEVIGGLVGEVEERLRVLEKAVGREK